MDLSPDLSESAWGGVDDREPHGGLEVAEVIVSRTRVAASAVPSDAAAGKFQEGTLIGVNSISRVIQNVKLGYPGGTINLFP